MRNKSTSNLVFCFHEEDEEPKKSLLLPITGGKTRSLGNRGFAPGEEIVGYTEVTDDDFSRNFLAAKTWCRNCFGYVITNLPKSHGGKSVMFLHQYVFEHYHGEVPEGLTIDHIDRNKINNRADNFRLATEGFQKANQSIRCDNTSGYRGVTWDKARSQWAARVRKDNKIYHLGRFVDIRDAANAVNDAYAKHYPEIPAPNTIT